MLQHLHPAHHRARRRRRARPATSSGCTSSRPSTRCRWSRSSRASETGDEALARAFDLVRRISKTPIVVNDSRGFFTSRVIGHFINEGVAMVGEGVEPASVEQAAAQAGYPAKVLSLMDELTLTLPAQDPRRDPARRRGGGRHLAPAPGGRGHRPDGRRVRPAGPQRRRGLLRVRRGRQPHRAVAGPARALHQARTARHPLRGHEGADALLRGAGHRPLPGGGRPDLRRRRQHRLHHGHRLPGLDGRRAPVHQRVRGRPARIRRPRAGAGRALRRAVRAARRCWWRRRRRARPSTTTAAPRAACTPPRRGERGPQLLLQRPLEGCQQGLEHHRLHMGRERLHRLHVLRVRSRSR